VRSVWKRILEFNNKYFTNWREAHPIFYSNAMAGELGEICSMIKRMAGGGTNKKGTVLGHDVVTECVDLLIYMVLLVENLGFHCSDFKAALDSKINVLYERMKSESPRTVMGRD